MRRPPFFPAVAPSAVLACAAGLLAAAPAAVADHHEAAKPSRILFVTQSAGFEHGSVRRQGGRDLAPAEVALKQLGQETGLFTVDATQDVASDFTKANLQNYDIVAFYTTGPLPIADADLDYFLNDWLKREGHGFLAFHSATDTYKEFEPYRSMINGRFAGHPWNANTTVTMAIHDPQFPGIKPLADFAASEGSDGLLWKDEIYQYEFYDPAAVKVLLSLDMSRTEPKKPYHVPVAWAREWGGGKVFYNNMGHREDTWTKRPFLDSVVGAVKWLRGEAAGDATPNPEVSAEMQRKSERAAG